MRLRRKSDGQTLVLSDANLVGKGGEARVYRLHEDPSLVAKVWYKPTSERAAKIAAMLVNPPVNPTAAQQHHSIAWPLDELQSPTPQPHTVGFLMPLVSGMHPLIDFFNPKTRRNRCPLFNWFYLHRTARNLAISIKALHERGYVVGDLNESNVLVAETALVTLVDTDSFQVWDARRAKLYRCRVGKPELTPPELQGKTFSQFDRKIEHDLFGLGTLLFQMLMEGTHPFAGTYTGAGEAPPYEVRIAAGHFPYSAGRVVPYKPKATAPPLEILYPLLQNLFIRCFQDGHANPEARPDAQAWQWALEEAENSLVSCWSNEQHVYSGHLQACPWCERMKLLGGRDPFPSVEAAKAGTHLAPIAPPPTRSGKQVRAPLQGRPNLPPPPVPKRVPVSTTKTGTRRSRPFRGFPAPRNDWAWLGLFFGILTLLTLPLPFSILSAFLGLLALICGAGGEISSYGWYLDGKGRVPARLAMLLGSIPWLMDLIRSGARLVP